MRTLREAWTEALYGPAGRFTLGHRDFATALTDPVTAPVLCAHLLDLALRTDAELGRGDFTVVDVGAGTGSFLAYAAAHGPARWRLVGVEVAPRPVGLDPRIAWGAALPETAGFLLAHEWLDDVPLDVVREGRTVLADGSLGGEHDPTWLDTWGGAHTLGTHDGSDHGALDVGTQDRSDPGAHPLGAEDGSARDTAWRRANDCLTAGRALAIDYGHTRATRRPTLTGWRGGRPVPPIFDGSCDLTAHVALDSLDADHRTTQREALSGLEPGDPATLDGLRRAGALRRLRDPDGLGAYGWITISRDL